MSGNRFVLDTNAILYILNGDAALADLLYGERLYASIISEIELLSYPSLSPKEEMQIRDFLSEFEVVSITEAVRDQSSVVRKKTRLKLPDSIIAATAIVLGVPLLSADKQFRTVSELNFILYER